MPDNDKPGFFMLDADTFKRQMIFDVWEDEPLNPTWLRRSEEKVAAPEAEIEMPEKQKSAA